MLSVTVFQNHLFFANSVFQLRVQAIPNFAYENSKVNALINAMASTQWSLVAQGFTVFVLKSMLESAPMPNTHALNSPSPLHMPNERP